MVRTLLPPPSTRRSGAVSVSGFRRVTVSDTTMEDNLVTTMMGGTVAGGALFFSNSGREAGSLDADLTLSSCRILRNQVPYNMAGANGGGVSASGISHVRVESTTFSGNHVEGSGGGLSLLGSGGDVKLDVQDSTFAENSASMGGGLCVVNGKSTVLGTSFSLNTASSYGGGAYLMNNTGVWSGNAFSRNAADEGAGAVFAIGSISPTFQSNTYRRNRPDAFVAQYVPPE